jgi:hypothetical protein
MEKGIPNAAWEPIEGDDKKVASALKKRNGKEASGQTTMASLWSKPERSETEEVTRAVAELEAASDADAGALAAKESRWAEIVGSGAYRHQRFVADAWCAAFVWPKPSHGGAVVEAAPTMGLWADIRDGKGVPPALTVTTVEELARQYWFFHWHLAFPTVFARGGFDVVLGNPPWERVKLQEQEFFASRSDSIAGASNAATRKKLIAALPKTDIPLWQAWCNASREADGQSHLIRGSGRYPLCGKGDVNTYAVFAEHNRDILTRQGRAGFVAPAGLVMDDTTKEFFQSLLNVRRLAAVFHFENEERLFPEVHHAFRFCLVGIGTAQRARLSFFARRVSDLSDSARQLELAPAEFEVLNPNTRTCPSFRFRRDAIINLAVYRRAGVLVRENVEHGNPWGIQFRTRLWHMAEDSEHFQTRAQLLAGQWVLQGNRFLRDGAAMVPLYEAKMVHHFDHRFGTYDGQTQEQRNQGKLPELNDRDHQTASRFAQPNYWVAETEVESRLREFWLRPWLLGWRNITGSTVLRTLIPAFLPRTAAAHSFPLLFPSEKPRLVLALYANLCSLVLDYTARQKVGGLNLTCNYIQQFPLLAPQEYANAARWCLGSPLSEWLVPRVLELTYNAWDLEAFAKDVGYDGPPFRWDPARRFLLRAEIDAAFFHLYGLSRDDTDYILDTFPIVRKNDEKAHGEYRTKRVILEVYDAMAEAARTGKPYVSRLEPPPADPRVAHPRRRSVMTMPAAPPQPPAQEDAFFFVAAMLHESGGTIPRATLKRVANLRRQPRLVVALTTSSADLGAEAGRWAERVVTRTLAELPVDPFIDALEERQAVRADVANGVRVVTAAANTPAVDAVPEWYAYEAGLLLAVIQTIPADVSASSDDAIDAARVEPQAKEGAA